MSFPQFGPGTPYRRPVSDVDHYAALLEGKSFLVDPSQLHQWRTQIVALQRHLLDLTLPHIQNASLQKSLTGPRVPEELTGDMVTLLGEETGRVPTCVRLSLTTEGLDAACYWVGELNERDLRTEIAEFLLGRALRPADAALLLELADGEYSYSRVDAWWRTLLVFPEGKIPQRVQEFVTRLQGGRDSILVGLGLLAESSLDDAQTELYLTLLQDEASPERALQATLKLQDH